LTPSVYEPGIKSLKMKDFGATKLARRHLNDYSKAELVSIREPIEKRLAELRVKAGKKLDPRANLPQGRARDILAKKAHVCPRQYEKVASHSSKLKESRY